MKEYKEVPIKAGEQIAKEYDKQEVIILSVDREHNKVHITTYGVDKRYCKNAELTGDFLAEILEIKDSKHYFDLIEEIKAIYLEKRGR